MDEYGFGAAALAGLRMFETCCRQSGRTMRLIERVQNDDRIVVLHEEEARRLRHLLHNAGKKDVTVLVIQPGHIPTDRLHSAAKGRTFFDHEWQQQWFESALSMANRDLEAFQRATSRTWPQAPDGPSEALMHRFDRIHR